MKKLPYFIILCLVFYLLGCGNTQTNVEVVGQVKSLQPNTPFIIPDYITVDLSLGVVKNGIGSMSQEDIQLMVEDKDHLVVLKEAMMVNKLVQINYNIKRYSPIFPDKRIMSVSIID